MLASVCSLWLAKLGILVRLYPTDLHRSTLMGSQLAPPGSDDSGEDPPDANANAIGAWKTSNINRSGDNIVLANITLVYNRRRLPPIMLEYWTLHVRHGVHK